MKVFVFKMFLIIVAIILVILAILPVYFDPIARKIVEQKVYPIFANRLKIGSVKISFLRSMVELEDIELKQPEGFGDGNLLKVKSLQARVALLPFFKNNILLRAITVNNPEVIVIKTRDNKINTDYILAEQKEDGKVHEKTAKTTAPANTAARPFTMNLGSLSINKAAVTLYDYKIRQKQPALMLTDITVEVKDVDNPNNSNTRTRFSINGNITSTQGNKAPFKCAGEGIIFTRPSSITAKNTIENLPLADYAYFMPEAKVTAESGNAWVTSQNNLKDDYLESFHHVDVKNLRLASAGDNLFGKTFFDLPAAGLMRFLDATGGKLSFDFQVKGNIHNLKFKLREEFIKEITKSLVKTIGSAATGTLRVPGKAKDSLKQMFKFK